VAHFYCYLKPSHLRLSSPLSILFTPFAQVHRLLVFARAGLSQKPRGIAGATIVHRWRIESALMSRTEARTKSNACVCNEIKSRKHL
jgi:hypothetical protein